MAAGRILGRLGGEALMIVKKALDAFRPHIAPQQLRIGAGQVEKNQAVPGVAEALVLVETQKLGAETEILAQEDRRAFAVHLYAGDPFGKLFHILPKDIQLFRSPRRQRHRPRRVLRLSKRSQIILQVIRAQVREHELPREKPVLRADADRAEKNFVAGIFDNVASDAAPEQKQRRIFSLIFAPHERPAELESRSQMIDELAFIGEQAAGVKALQAVARNDRVRRPDAIGGDNLALLPVPKK